MLPRSQANKVHSTKNALGRIDSLRFMDIYCTNKEGCVLCKSVQYTTFTGDDYTARCPLPYFSADCNWLYMICLMRIWLHTDTNDIEFPFEKLHATAKSISKCSRLSLTNPIGYLIMTILMEYFTKFLASKYTFSTGWLPTLKV